VRVQGTDGVWHVRRRWAPRHLGRQTLWHRFTDRFRRVRERTVDGVDAAPDGCIDGIGEGIVAFLAIIAAVVFLIFVGIPLLVALGELLFLVLLIVAGIVGRVLFRRPWWVDAAAPGGAHFEWSVVGWRRSGRAVQLVADRLAAGDNLPTQAEVAGIDP
jgi:hypothetical protein